MGVQAVNGNRQAKRGYPDEIGAVRCNRCHRLLGVFETAKGEIKCPKCGYVQKVNVEHVSESALTRGRPG